MKNTLNKKRLASLFALAVTLSAGGYFALTRSQAQEAAAPKQPRAPVTLAKPEKIVTGVENLDKVSVEGQRQFLSRISERRHQTQEQLIMQLFSTDNQVQCLAACLLGMERHDQSVSSLVEQITLQDEHWPRQQTSLWFWDRYPALEALTKIGKPATRALIENIESNDEAKSRQFSALALRVIETPEVAQFILQRAIDRQKQNSKKVRLKAALAELLIKPS